MIPRYSRPEMTADLVAGEPLPDLVRDRGAMPARRRRRSASFPRAPPAPSGNAAAFEVERIDEIERETHHDVIAFLTNLAEHVGPEARFVHQGMTSSDVLDTCFAVQLTEAADLLLADLDAVLGGAEAARLRAQIHAHRRAQPRRPRRADAPSD